MIEIQADLWDVPADIRIITTNGFVKNDGTAVMGRGCAWEAAQRWPYLPKMLGDWLKCQFIGGRPVAFCLKNNPASAGWDLWAYQVKYNWWENASPYLIMEGAQQLKKAMDSIGSGRSAGRDEGGGYANHPLRVVMPRPGCGNGGLSWTDVRPMLEEHLDDRFTVVSYRGED